MLKRVLITLVLMAASAGFAVVVYGAFIASHQATGNINTAVTATEALYICQPSGTTVSPQCPIDTNGADEIIYAANEDLIAGSVAWQKVRVTNVGSVPWDIFGMTRSWTETSDPSGLCDTVPEGVLRFGTATALDGPTGPGVTVLGVAPGTGAFPEPVEGVTYPNSSTDPNTFNDNHPSVSGSVVFDHLRGSGSQRTVHVEPGKFEDLLLGIRLPIGTTDDCLNVVWTLTTTWDVETHIP